MRIVTYNLNGIRAAMTKGLVEWVASQNLDIVCFQETKAQPDQVDMSEFEALGYQHYWHSAQKKGYSGVCTLTRQTPDDIIEGCGIEAYDYEGRIIRTDFGDMTLLNCYFPSGTTGDIRQDFKMVFLEDFFDWVQDLRRTRPNIILAGDYNIAHCEIDIHDPKGNKKSSGFLPEERAWMDKLLAAGFTDAYRKLNPTTVQYSWWTFRAGARANNKGWRIDYQTTCGNLTDRLKFATQIPQAMHSDHCPVLLELA